MKTEVIEVEQYFSVFGWPTEQKWFKFGIL